MTTGEPPTATASQPEAGPVEIATGFVEAFGALDADAAVAYLADDADLSGTDAWTVEGLPVLLSLLEAMGYEQILDSCAEQGSSSTGTDVRCTFAFHAIPSHELGLGPYDGSFFELTVRDGKIADASWSWETADRTARV